MLSSVEASRSPAGVTGPQQGVCCFSGVAWIVCGRRVEPKNTQQKASEARTAKRRGLRTDGCPFMDGAEVRG